MLKTVATCAGLLALFAPQQAQAACATAPQLHGEPALVASVTEELTRRGSTAQGEDCASLQVQISAEGTSYLVAIDDSSGRRCERQVTSVPMVATLIETWMVPGAEQPVLAPAPPAPVITAPPAKAPAPSRLVLSAQAESAMANDSSLWMGLGVMACLRLGRFCPGMLVRFTDDEGWVGDDGPPGARRSLGGLLLGSTPFTLGRVRLVPRLGVGVAWTWGEQPRGHREEAPPAQDHRGWLRTEIGLAGQLLLRGQWALSVDLSTELAPLALKTRISDPHDLREPWIFTRLGLGVTWGTP